MPPPSKLPEKVKSLFCLAIRSISHGAISRPTAWQFQEPIGLVGQAPEPPGTVEGVEPPPPHPHDPPVGLPPLVDGGSAAGVEPGFAPFIERKSQKSFAARAAAGLEARYSPITEKRAALFAGEMFMTLIQAKLSRREEREGPEIDGFGACGLHRFVTNIRVQIESL